MEVLGSSGEYFVDYCAADVGETEIAALIAICQPCMVQS